MRLGLLTVLALSAQRVCQPPATLLAAASLLRLSPDLTVKSLPGLAVVVGGDEMGAVVRTGALVLARGATAAGARVAVRDVDGAATRTGAGAAATATLEEAPPLLRVRPALTEQTGHAPGPWLARVRWAMVICADFDARSARGRRRRRRSRATSSW